MQGVYIMDTELTFPKGAYVFLWGGLIKNAGGMTRAMLKRAELLLSEGIEVKILLCARGMEQLDGVLHYNENGFPLIKESNFITMEQYLGSACSDDTQKHPNEYGINFKEQLYAEENGDKIYFKNGEEWLRELKTEISRKKLVKVLSGQEQKKVDIVYWDDILTRIVEYRENENTKVTRFFSRTGFCFLRITEEKALDEYRIKKVILFDENKKQVRTFKTLNELSQLFFCDYLRTVKDYDIFAFQDPFLDFDPGFAEMYNPGKHIYRIGINHGCGFGEERHWYNRLNPRIRDMIEEKVSPDVEAFICLTKEAADDFRKRLGNRNIIYQVPNTVFWPEALAPFEKRDKYRVVFIGRFAKEKQISHILKAWKVVEKYVPEAHLHLYGRGGLEQEFARQISEEGLTNIKMEGFTNSVGEEYQKAGLSLLCSDFEGMPLSLLESLANGCPVVAYSFKYGPRDVIVSGKNGYLCEKNNIKQVADSIIKYFQLEDAQRKAMTDCARASVEIYKESNYKKNWVTMLNEVVRRYPCNLRINKCEMNVITYAVDVIHSKVTYNCRLELGGGIPQAAYGQERIYIKRYAADMHYFTEEDVSSIADYEKCIFDITFAIKSDETVGLCILWNNSFFEKKINLKK